MHRVNPTISDKEYDKAYVRRYYEYIRDEFTTGGDEDSMGYNIWYPVLPGTETERNNYDLTSRNVTVMYGDLYVNMWSFCGFDTTTLPEETNKIVVQRGMNGILFTGVEEETYTFLNKDTESVQLTIKYVEAAVSDKSNFSTEVIQNITAGEQYELPCYGGFVYYECVVTADEENAVNIKVLLDKLREV